MRDIIVTEHHESCSCNSKDMHELGLSSCRSWQQVFYFNGEFIFVETPNCIWTNPFLSDFEKIEIMLEKSTHKWIIDVNRSIHMDREFKNYRLRGARLKKWVEEVNFLYYDNAGKEYAVTTRIKFTQDLINQIKLKEEYEKAIEYLNNSAFSPSVFKDNIEGLYRKNMMYLTPAEEYRTLKHLRLELNKKIKQLTL